MHHKKVPDLVVYLKKMSNWTLSSAIRHRFVSSGEGVGDFDNKRRQNLLISKIQSLDMVNEAAWFWCVSKAHFGMATALDMADCLVYFTLFMMNISFCLHGII